MELGKLTRHYKNYTWHDVFFQSEQKFPEYHVSTEDLANIDLSEGKSFYGMTGFDRFTDYDFAFGGLLTITNASVDSENISQNMSIQYGYQYDEAVLYYTTAEMLETYGSNAWNIADTYDILKAANKYIYAFRYDFRFDYSEYHKMYNFVEDLEISFVDANGNPLEGYEAYIYPTNNEVLSFTLYFGLGEVKELTLDTNFF